MKKYLIRFGIVREILSGLYDLKDWEGYTIFGVVVGWLRVGVPNWMRTQY